MILIVGDCRRYVTRRAARSTLSKSKKWSKDTSKSSVISRRKWGLLEQPPAGRRNQSNQSKMNHEWNPSPSSYPFLAPPLAPPPWRRPQQSRVSSNWLCHLLYLRVGLRDIKHMFHIFMYQPNNSGLLFDVSLAKWLTYFIHCICTYFKYSAGIHLATKVPYSMASHYYYHIYFFFLIWNNNHGLRELIYFLHSSTSK